MKNLKVIIRPLAEVDLREAMEWYETNQPGLGNEFLSLIDRKIVQISERPQQFPERHKSVRVAVLERFPFVIHFRIVGDEIVIFSFYHTSRSIKKALKRVK